MRITAGEFRGRRVRVPEIPGLRPTPAKARQALFNIIGDISSWHVLELFSGSGLMALECLSRGASRVISIERNHRLCQNMIDICMEWGLRSRWQIIHGDASTMLKQLPEGRFELIFADPPYDRGLAELIPQWLYRNRIHCDQLVIEESVRAKPRWPGGWTQIRYKRYGDSCLYFLSQTEENDETDRDLSRHI